MAHDAVSNKKVISYLMLKGFILAFFHVYFTDINNSGEIDKKDFEIAIQVSGVRMNESEKSLATNGI